MLLYRQKTIPQKESGYTHIIPQVEGKQYLKMKRGKIQWI